jgi:hypothetical protein
VTQAQLEVAGMTKAKAHRLDPAKKATGRPRLKFDQAIADRICEAIVQGKSLRRICAAKDMPSVTTCMKWLREDAIFAQQYARAKEEQADGYADELIELANEATATNANAIRVRADILKWVCSKLKPRRYGDRLDVRHEGQASGLTIVLAELTPDQRAATVAPVGTVRDVEDAQIVGQLPAPFPGEVTH